MTTTKDDPPPAPEFSVWMARVNLRSVQSPKFRWCTVLDTPTGYEALVWYPGNGRSPGRWGDTLDLEIFTVLEAFMRWQASEIARLRAGAP